MRSPRCWYFVFASLFLLSLSCQGAEETGAYRFENDWVRYEARENTGLTPAQLPKGKPFEFPRPRPAVPFDLAPFAEVKTPESRLRRREIEVRFPEEAGVARQAGVRFGFPLPAGTLFSAGEVDFLGPDRKPLPAQFSVTSRWPDGSIKWLLLTSRLPVEAQETKSGWVVFGDGVRREEGKSPLTLAEEEGRLVISTGPLQVEFDKTRFNLFRSVRVDRDGDGRFDPAEAGWRAADPGVQLVRPDGKIFGTAFLPPEQWQIEERGPERIVLRVSGKYGSADGESWMRYVTRLTFSAGSPVVGIAHTHVNDDLSREFSDFTSLDLDFLPPRPIATVMTDFPAPEGTAARFLTARSLEVFQRDDRSSVWTVEGKSREGGRSAGGWTVSDGETAAGFVLHDFWERWPKGFRAGTEGVRLGLLPKQPSPDFGAGLPYHLMFPFVAGNYRFKWGMASTERLTIDFSGTLPRKQLLAEARSPVVAVVPAAWYEETGALGKIPAPDGGQFEVWDAFVARSFEAHRELSAEQREYGFFNYGDWFGERKRNWGNNEYDRAHGFFQQFARTGRTAYFRLALQAARHQADVDIVHAYPDLRFVGANHQHSIGHTGVWEGPNYPKKATWSHAYDSHTDGTNGHTWIDGMMDAWCLAGDASVMESALALGEHLTWAVAPGFKSLGTHERSAGWSLKALMGAYRARPDPAYLAAASQIAGVAVAAQTKDQGGAWAHRLPSDHAAGQEVGNCPFLIGILLTALAEYHEQTADPAVWEVLVSGSRWLQRAWNGTYGGWPYSADPDGKPLSPIYPVNLNPLIANAVAYVGEKSGNAESMAIVRKAMVRSFWFSESEAVGKELAELMLFTPDTLARLAEFLKKTDPGAASGVLAEGDVALRDELVGSFPPRVDFWLRGPRKRTVFFSLFGEAANGSAQRKLYGSARVEADSGRLELRKAAGGVLWEKTFPASEKLTVPLELAGAKGDQFALRIEDEITGAWRVGLDEGGLVADVAGGLHFAGLNLQRFWFFVPPDTPRFSLKLKGVHHGEFGAAVIRPDGRTAVFARGSNSRMEPGLGTFPRKPAGKILEVVPEREQTGKLWSVSLWAAGDLICELDDVPSYLAPTSGSWFLPTIPPKE